MSSTRRAGPPPTVILFVGTMLLMMLGFLALNGPDVERTMLLVAPWLILLFIGLWFGNRVAWLILTALFAFNIMVLLAGTPHPWAIPINVTLFALLVAGPTRRHVAGR